MNLCEILKKISEGDVIAREGEKYEFKVVFVNKNIPLEGIINSKQYPCYAPTVEDLLADDWIVLDKRN